MWAGLLAVAVIVFNICHFISEKIRLKSDKQLADSDGIYIHNGDFYDFNTNKKVYRSNEYGEKVIREVVGGKLIRRINNHDFENPTKYHTVKNTWYSDGVVFIGSEMKFIPRGIVYTDLNTNDKYVIRRIDNVKVYMNMEGMVVRKTDGQIWKDDHDTNREVMSEDEFEKFKKNYNNAKILEYNQFLFSNYNKRTKYFLDEQKNMSDYKIGE